MSDIIAKVYFEVVPDDVDAYAAIRELGTQQRPGTSACMISMAPAKYGSAWQANFQDIWRGLGETVEEHLRLMVEAMPHGND